MKKILKLIAVMCIVAVISAFAVGVAGCSQEVALSAPQASVTLKAEEVASYNFASLFKITVDGSDFAVTADLVDSSAVKAEAGEYDVTCAYGGKQATVKVIVVVPEISVAANSDGVTIGDGEVKNYDYASLFTVTEDGKAVDAGYVVDSSAVKAQAGTYEVTCTYKDNSAKLSVTVAEVAVSAKSASADVAETEVSAFDYASLFEVTVNGAQVNAADFVDASAVKTEVGTYEVTCAYLGKNAKISVNVVAISVTAKDVTIKERFVDGYDFTTLFEISKNGTPVAVEASFVYAEAVKAKAGEYFVTCAYGGKIAQAKVTVESTVIELSATVENNAVSVRDKLVADYDFTTLFAITVDGENVPVEASYVDSSAVTSEEGEYEVTCTYEGRQVVVTVTVTGPVYKLTSSVDEVSVKQSAVAGYDFVALFSASVDDEAVSITEDMTATDVTTVVGQYSFTVTYNQLTKTIKVNVIDDHIIEVSVNFNNIELEESNVKAFDSKTMFSLYVDGAAVKVTADMIDDSALKDVYAGNSYEIVFKYSKDMSSCVTYATVKVVEDVKAVVVTKNVETYPNRGNIDLKTLFEITKGGKRIAVTDDMISGVVDYTVEGENIIKLKFENEEYYATVTVKLGVIIEYATTDKINIVKGTKKDTYSFANDFVVFINGLKFDKVMDSYLDAEQLEAIDFDVPGTYELTITIPFNDKQLGLIGVNFGYTSKTIKYVVVKNDYEITVLDETVVLPQNTTSYNPFKNLSVKINGRNQSLVEDPEWVDPIDCYVRLISAPVDFSDIGLQVVEIAVYVDGPDSDPVNVTYKLMMESDVQITAKDITAFSGTTVYAKDLFTITANGKNVNVTDDMLYGRVDVFTPGVYVVELNFRGTIAEARAVILNSKMMGTYQTLLTTIVDPPSSDSGSWEEDEEGYGSYNENYGDSEEAKVLGDMTLSTKEFVVDGKKATFVSGIDANTAIVEIGTGQYTMYYTNGIVIFVPDNPLKLSYSNTRRPMMYVNINEGRINRYVTVNNSSAGHVLQLVTTVTYSIDTFQIRRNNGTTYWYGLKTDLASRSGSDSVYSVTWGMVYYDNGNPVNGDSTYMYFNGEKYEFTMRSNNIGVIDRKSETTRQWANMTFTGEIDGKQARLVTNAYESYTLYIGDEKAFDLSAMEVQNLQDGGPDYVKNTAFIYSTGERPTSSDGVFSYYFYIDPENKTFTVQEHDNYFGKYFTEDKKMYLFLDGYGMGLINFSTGSYYKYRVRYSVSEGVLTINYLNTLPDFAEGTYASFYMASLGNVITLKECDGTMQEGLRLENCCIETGAIVEIKSFKIGADLKKADFLKLIKIVTKEGELSDADKTTWSDAKVKKIDTSAIRWGTEGFYQFTITIDVAGTDITSYYAVQVLKRIYKDNPVVALYGNGVLFEENQLTIDQYGQFFLTASGVEYEGTVKIAEDCTFTGKGFSSTGTYVSLTGKLLSSGLIQVRATGFVTFQDYFTIGEKRVAGVKGHILRAISVGSETTFIYAKTETQMGEVVTVTLDSGSSVISEGSIINLATADGVKIARINAWGDLDGGITLADAYRGTYVCDGLNPITLDGFGWASVNGSRLSYSLGSNNTAVIGTTVYEFNKDDYTYKVSDIVLDNNLLAGIRFTASYTFSTSDSYSTYTATTTFAFTGTIVVVTSVCNGYEEEEYETYAPQFASKTGAKGEYTVNGNIVKVRVNGIVFAFEISDVVRLNSIVCLSTTATSGTPGYFKVGTVFSKI